MPELPEVELYARYFARHALHQKIVRVRLLDARVAGTRKLGSLRRRKFERVSRHGKHLFVHVTPSVARGRCGRVARSTYLPPTPVPRYARNDIWLHIHFGMTGDLEYDRGDPPRFARIIFDFDNGAHLAYADMRLFGVVDLTPSPETYIREHRLGPDPLQIGLPEFRRLVSGRRGRIKALLMSQDVIAGIGNLYADEALYRASIDPRRATNGLGPDDVKRLFTAIRGVLREAIEFKSRGRDYPARFLVPHREEGERCPRCGGTIRRTVVGGRTTYFCGMHQR